MAAYNIAVVSAKTNNDSKAKQRHAFYASETSGLLLLAFLILVVTIVRYWHAIHWSVR